jgi:hypothetical protein
MSLVGRGNKMDYKLTMFLGKPVRFTENVNIYPITVDEIEQMGESQYALHLMFATFNRKRIIDVFKISNPMISDEDDDYDVLTNALSYEICDLIARSLSFFVRQEVFYDGEFSCFRTNDFAIVSRDNYVLFRDVIRKQNCLDEKKEPEPKFRNEKARQYWLKSEEARLRRLARDGLQLKDLLSILTYDYGNNGINIFNVGDLTVYQMYERWERLNLKDKHSQMVQVWANGLLQDTSLLQEWMIKTKI